jgi:hypothetical protein
MRDRITERAAYGRAIRERAQSLIEAFGPEAAERAAEAAAEPGATAEDRCFWRAVAERVMRQSMIPRARFTAGSRHS